MMIQAVPVKKEIKNIYFLKKEKTEENSVSQFFHIFGNHVTEHVLTA